MSAPFAPRPATPLAGKPVARLTSGAQMVASLPLLLGFQPTESVVVLCCHEPRGRMGLIMRLDLPSEGWEAETAEQLAARVRQERATRVVIAVYTEQRDHGERAGEELVDLLCAELSDLVITEAVLVRGGRFFSYLCSDPSCCPDEGTPVDVAADSSPLMLLKAENALEGRVMVADRDTLAASLEGPEPLEEEAAVRRCEAAAAGARPDARMLWATVVDRFRVPPAELSDDEAAALAVSLQDKVIRDGIAASPEPDVPVVVRLLAELCRRTPDAFAAPVCTLFGWLSYSTGGGAVVSIALDRALRCDPGYEFARLLEEAWVRQMPPERIRFINRTTAVTLGLSPSTGARRRERRSARRRGSAS